jgi:predicted nucleotidyltransferase
MAGPKHHSVDRTEALTPVARRALDLFGSAARAAYGDGLVQLVLFGSHSRAEGRSDSDIDVAVVLRDLPDRRADRDRLADLAYDVIVETSLDIQTVPVSLDEWEHPEHHTNPALIRAIKRDGVVVEAGNAARALVEGDAPADAVS